MKLIHIAPALAAALLFTGTAHAQAAATTRHYDCSKPGNANKAACKGVPAAATTVATPAAGNKTTTTRNYDCTKAGNANKAACKTAVMAKPVAPAAAPVATTASKSATGRTVATSKTTATNVPTTTHASGPNGATAQCKDGTYSKSAHRSGTCAGHKGVATWY